MSKDPKETIYAPEHIYIIKRPSGSFVSEWCIRPQKTGNLIYESIKYHHDSKYQEAQERIKDLEKFANKVGQCIKNVQNKDYDYEPSHAYDDILDAFNALEKEIE